MKALKIEIPYEIDSPDRTLHHKKILMDKKFMRELYTEWYQFFKNGGKILMVEPANSLWGRFIYTNFHHEPFNPKGGWTFPSSGPLSDANGALPWIILKRDRELFEEKFPMLHISKMKNHTPLRYLLSGGFTLKQLMPDFMYRPIKAFEKIMSPIQAFSMFSTIVIEKRDDQ
jgi:hypothetical protein